MAVQSCVPGLVQSTGQAIMLPATLCNPSHQRQHKRQRWAPGRPCPPTSPGLAANLAGPLRAPSTHSQIVQGRKSNGSYNLPSWSIARLTKRSAWKPLRHRLAYQAHVVRERTRWQWGQVVHSPCTQRKAPQPAVELQFKRRTLHSKRTTGGCKAFLPIYHAHPRAKPGRWCIPLSWGRRRGGLETGNTTCSTALLQATVRIRSDVPPNGLEQAPQRSRGWPTSQGSSSANNLTAPTHKALRSTPFIQYVSLSSSLIHDRSTA